MLLIPLIRYSEISSEEVDDFHTLQCEIRYFLVVYLFRYSHEQKNFILPDCIISTTIYALYSNTFYQRYFENMQKIDIFPMFLPLSSLEGSNARPSEEHDFDLHLMKQISTALDSPSILYPPTNQAD